MTQVLVKNKDGELIKQVEIAPEGTLLKQLESQGLEIPNACRMGMCAACMCYIESGEDFVVKDRRGEPAFPLGTDEVMTCIGGVVDTDEEIILKTLY